MTEKRVWNDAALDSAAAILARLVEAEAHQLARDMAEGGEPRAAQRIEAVAKAGRAVAVLAQTLDKTTPSTGPDTQEDEGMNGDHAEFDALPIERKRAEIHRILDRMLAERGPASAGGDGQRGAEASAPTLAAGGAESAAAA